MNRQANTVANTFTNVTRASNFGDVSDVDYRLRRERERPPGARRHRVGRSQRRTRGDGHLRSHRQGERHLRQRRGVLASTSGTLASTTGYPSTLYCRVVPPYQPDWKGLVSYPLPWWDLRASATVQNRPGPQILANYTINAGNALTQTTLGRTPTGGSQVTQLIAPNSISGERFTQVDVRFGRASRPDAAVFRARSTCSTCSTAARSSRRTTRAVRHGARRR